MRKKTEEENPLRQKKGPMRGQFWLKHAIAPLERGADPSAESLVRESRHRREKKKKQSVGKSSLLIRGKGRKQNRCLDTNEGQKNITLSSLGRDSANLPPPETQRREREKALKGTEELWRTLKRRVVFLSKESDNSRLGGAGHNFRPPGKQRQQRKKEPFAWGDTTRKRRPEMQGIPQAGEKKPTPSLIEKREKSAIPYLKAGFGQSLINTRKGRKANSLWREIRTQKKRKLRFSVYHGKEEKRNYLICLLGEGRENLSVIEKWTQLVAAST